MRKTRQLYLEAAQMGALLHHRLPVLLSILVLSGIFGNELISNCTESNCFIKKSAQWHAFIFFS